MPDQPLKPNDQDEITGLDQSRLMAALSYMAVLVLVPLLVARDDPFVNFHAKQGLVILVGLILAIIVVQWSALIGNILWIVLLIGEVIGLMNALLGRRWKIPVVGDIANKFRI